MSLEQKDIEEGQRPSDVKDRWGGLLENPFVSQFQRLLLDGGRRLGMKKVFKDIPYQTMLDVGCGLGEFSSYAQHIYCGIDNSFSRLVYAKAKRHRTFVQANAVDLPFSDGLFDLSILIDTSHHLDDTAFVTVLNELCRITKGYILISDPILTENQPSISRFFYGLDRGGCFRTQAEMGRIFSGFDNLRIKQTHCFRTFPGIYTHMAFVLEIKQR